MANRNMEKNRSDNSLTPISDYYRGKTVFLTGVTGFLGECFVVKLLRIGVKAVYVLIRSRRNMTPQERFEKMLQSPIFEPLRKERPNFADDIILISGSIDELELNLSLEDQATLFENIQLIIHAAADVRFDVPIVSTVIRNIRGTREMLRLARKMKHFENFIYTSTAYSFCMLNVIAENFYEPKFDSEEIIRIAESMTRENDPDVLNAISAKIISPWPNTYTFSKAITEDLVRKHRQHFKITIVRPAIVTATFREPIEGWASNLTGANGVFTGITGGVLRCLKLDKGIPIDMVFGDYVVNSTLACGYDVSIGSNAHPPIYNIVSSNDYVKTFDGMVKEFLPFREKEVPSKALWLPTFNFCDSDASYFICNMAFHVIPAVIFDVLLRIKGEKPKILKLYRQIHSFGDVITFFISSYFKFDNTNMKRVCSSMTPGDKKTFPCDFSEVHWPDYRDIFLYKGIVQHLLGDLSDTQTFNRNSKRMKLMHYSFLTFCVCSAALLFYVLLKQILF